MNELLYFQKLKLVVEMYNTGASWPKISARVGMDVPSIQYMYNCYYRKWGAKHGFELEEGDC